MGLIVAAIATELVIDGLRDALAWEASGAPWVLAVDNRYSNVAMDRPHSHS
jgi:hypothetical protein